MNRNVLVLSTTDELRQFIQDEISPPPINPGPTEAPMDFEWVSNREAMALLHLSKTTLQRYRSEGVIPYSKVLGSIYYRRSDLGDLLEKNLRIAGEEVVQ